jgi:hypothetical protein
VVKRAPAPKAALNAVPRPPPPDPRHAPEPAGDPYLSDFTCAPDGDGEWLISYTLHRPPESPVIVESYRIPDGALTLRTVTVKGESYEVNKGFSSECGL